MRLTEDESRRRLAAARVARLATAAADGRPHLVPVTFTVLDDDTLVTAVDQKPKSSRDLRRLRNIAANPAVSVLADSYDEDWTRLWWVRADGHATVVPADRATVAALTAKYPQYQAAPPQGPVIRITVDTWSGWSATPPP